ncbi:MAG: hypothetical protein ABWZ52_07640 [Acidimicrobiales bacterium]
MQLSDVIRSVRRHWRVSAGILLLTAVSVPLFVVTRNETRDPDQWQASIQLLVPARDEDGTRPEGVPPTLLQGQATVAQSEEITEDAIFRAGLEDRARSDFEFEFDSNERGDILTLSAAAPTPDEAEALADNYANAFANARREAVAAGAEGGQGGARRSLEVLEERLAEVDAALDDADPVLFAYVKAVERPVVGDAEPGSLIDLPADTPLDTVLLVYQRRSLINRIEGAKSVYAENSTEAIVPGSYSTVVERSAPNQITPELPSPLIPIAVAVGVGILLALAVPVLMDRLDHSIRDARTAGTALAAPVLSTIPPSSRANLATLARPGSERDSAYRRLAAASLATDQLPRAITVMSPVGEMQDSVAANFAAALAGLGLRVALVATAERQSWYAEAADGVRTLPELLDLAQEGRLNGQIRETMAITPIDNLRVVPHGATGPEALLDGFPALMQAFADAGIDVTVIAAPAMLDEPSATILAWSTRSVLWVIESGEVTEQEASEAASQLALAGATPFGVAVVAGKG